MLIKKEDRSISKAVRFNGIGEIAMTSILEPKPENFSGQGRLFAHTVMKPGQYFGKHSHSGEFEIYYILKGAGIYIDNDEEYPVKAGDVMVCEDGGTHGIRTSGDEDLEFIALILYSGK